MSAPDDFKAPFTLERVRGKTVLIWRGKGLEICSRSLDHEALRQKVYAALEHHGRGNHDQIKHLRTDRHDPKLRTVARPAERLLEVPEGTSAEERRRMTLAYLADHGVSDVSHDGETPEIL